MTATPFAPAPESAGERRFQWPADYYSSATVFPVLPRWVSFGCGAASVVVLVIVFAGGAFLASGGFVQMMDFVFGMTLGEMRGMYTKEVSAADKQQLESEIEAMRKNLREEKVAPKAIEPILQTIRKATRDEKLNAAEVHEITAAARKANQRKRR